MHMEDRECLLSTQSNHSSTVCAVSFLHRSGNLHRFDKPTFGPADHVVEVLLQKADCFAVEFHTH
jgi:hypothetical protein